MGKEFQKALAREPQVQKHLFALDQADRTAFSPFYPGELLQIARMVGAYSHCSDLDTYQSTNILHALFLTVLKQKNSLQYPSSRLY